MSDTVDNEEIECKFLDIDQADIENKLLGLGAELKLKELFRREVMDFPDWRLDNNYSWLRIRDKGHQTTISFKQRIGVTDGQNDAGMKEIEFVASDFDKACQLFEEIGMISKFYEENRRTMYILDGVEVCIDEWPMIPAYVEVEGQSWQAVQAVSEKLGFNWADRKIYSTNQVYEKYGIREKDYSIITFDKQIKK